jgi:curved DNA-binding protein CbpA
MSNLFHGTYYELLEVRPGSPQHEVTKAYERAKLTYSSDNPALYTVFSSEEARELLKLIEEAYLILGNTIFRNRYDEILKDPQIRIEELKFQDIVGPIVSSGVDKQKAHFRPTFKVDVATEEYIRHEENCDGAYLKRVREYKNIALDKMSEITRINLNYLVALEKNSWADLPAQVFVRGFVVQISRLLGLDEKKTADSFMRIYKAHCPKPK